MTVLNNLKLKKLNLNCCVMVLFSNFVNNLDSEKITDTMWMKKCLRCKNSMKELLLLILNLMQSSDGRIIIFCETHALMDYGIGWQINIEIKYCWLNILLLNECIEQNSIITGYVIKNYVLNMRQQ